MIAIVGCQRSGTTLTGQILGAHPAAVLIDEFDGLYPWFDTRERDAHEAERMAHDMLAAVAQKYRAPETRFSQTGDGLAISPNVSVLVLKAPNLTCDDERLARMGVPVVAVYPVRDPRSVVASGLRFAHVPYMDKQIRLVEAQPETARAYAASIATMRDATLPHHIRNAAMWAVKSSRADAFAAAGFPVHQFRYEDLVRDPQTQIARMLQACALYASPAVFEPERSYVGFGPGDTDRTRRIDERSLDAWRSLLDDAQAREVLQHAGDFATRLGYVA